MVAGEIDKTKMQLMAQQRMLTAIDKAEGALGTARGPGEVIGLNRPTMARVDGEPPIGRVCAPGDVDAGVAQGP